MHITLVAGARPNFMKIAPIIRAIESASVAGKQIEYQLVHTGQHYDQRMSRLFFDELSIPEPDVNLEAGSGTQAEQTAVIMVRFETYLTTHPTDLVIVVGDVTSTLACSIVAKKLGVQVAHVEGGIRSGDMMMPEEVNRIVTDSITDFFFTTSEVANQNLRRAGVPGERIFFVGNTMIDTLLYNLDRLKQPALWREHDLASGNYLLLTLHRPSNVDESEQLERLLRAITANAAGLPVVFPVHPRTEKTLGKLSLEGSLIRTRPMGYLEFIYLVKHARGVITDSGGITEETTVLGIPCMTIRDTTERPETVTVGTNELLGASPDKIPDALQILLQGNWKRGSVPERWDGRAAERIVKVLQQIDVPV